MPPVGFEPTISASERPKTYALERAATETVRIELLQMQNQQGYSNQQNPVDRLSHATVTYNFVVINCQR